MIEGRLIRQWLARTGLVLAVVVTAAMCGNLEAAGVALLLATFAGYRGRVQPARLKVAMLAVWLGAFVLAGVVTAVAAGPETPTRRKVVLGLYDLNCNAPFGTYRYPRDVQWLADGGFNLYYGKWNRVLVCEPWVK
jgi:hypothetical protein